MQVLIFSVLLGLLWLRNGQDTTFEGRRSVLGVLFFILINQAFGGVFSVIFQFRRSEASSLASEHRTCTAHRATSCAIR